MFYAYYCNTSRKSKTPFIMYDTTGGGVVSTWTPSLNLPFGDHITIPSYQGNAELTEAAFHVYHPGGASTTLRCEIYTTSALGALGTLVSDTTIPYTFQVNYIPMVLATFPLPNVPVGNTPYLTVHLTFTSAIAGPNYMLWTTKNPSNSSWFYNRSFTNNSGYTPSIRITAEA